MRKSTDSTVPTSHTQAKLEAIPETLVNHTKSISQVSPSAKASACGLRNLIRLTPVQVGLRPIEEQTPTSSPHIPTSLINNPIPILPQSPIDTSESLNTQSPIYPTPLCSIATEKRQDLQTQHLTPPHTIPFSPNPLKRKVIEKELNIFAKRLRKANSGQEPLYFDPKTVALIPQSRLEYFILKESQKAEDEAQNRKSFYHFFSEACSHTIANPNSSTSMAEEAGLIKPPPSS